MRKQMTATEALEAVAKVRAGGTIDYDYLWPMVYALADEATRLNTEAAIDQRSIGNIAAKYNRLSEAATAVRHSYPGDYGVLFKELCAVLDEEEGK